MRCGTDAVVALGKPFSASSDLSPAEQTAMEELQDNSIIILPADKGRMTVVMDRNKINMTPQFLDIQGGAMRSISEPAKQDELALAVLEMTG
jgi:hypothetical protein